MFCGSDILEKETIMNHNVIYIEKKRETIEQFLRIYTGLQQLFYRPYYNLLVLGLVGLFFVIWKSKDKFYSVITIPEIIEPIYQQFISVMLIIIFGLLILALIKQIGMWFARNDESALIIAFKPADLRNGYPILISKKRVKGTRVVKREFYTKIPKHRWEELQEEIEDSMNVSFVTPNVEYGGKNKDKSYRMVIYSTPTRNYKERGTLYDDEL